MRVAISGSTGLVGTALRTALEAAGDEVVAMVRPSTEGASPKGTIPWSPSEGRLEPADLEGVDAVVHLAGESIAGVWTAAKKRRIRDSRVLGTRLVAESIAACAQPPRVLISVSGINFYGDRGDEWLDETSSSGAGFMAGLCREWEGAADAARVAGVRVVHPRFGLALSTEGGLLPQMLLPFRLGLGGRLGDGSQWMSWISLEDLVAILRFLLARDDIEGPVNAVSPHPMTNRELSRALAAQLRRPAVLPVPAFVLKRLPGDLGDELLLASLRIRPAVLEAKGFSWEDPELEAALERILGDRR